MSDTRARLGSALSRTAPQGPHREGPRACRIGPTYENKGEIEVLPVQGSVYMLAGAGSNVTVQVGPNALFVVDTNEAAMSDKILAAIKTISPLPDPLHRQHERAIRIMSAATSGSPSRPATRVERVLRAGRARLRAGERVRADDEPEGRIARCRRRCGRPTRSRRRSRRCS